MLSATFHWAKELSHGSIQLHEEPLGNILSGYYEEENMDFDELPAFSGTIGLSYVIAIKRNKFSIQ